MEAHAVKKYDEVAPVEHAAAGSPEEASGLVALAIRERVAPEVLEKLVALQERISDRNARAAFMQAVAKFREACPPIMKTRENTQFEVTRDGRRQKARYAPLEEIDRVARPVAASFGLAWTWDTKVEGPLMHVTCRILHELGHSESSTVSMPWESKAGSSPQQKYGSTQTYGMRYSLIAALGLTTADEDVDGQGASDVEVISPSQAAELRALLKELAVAEVRITKWARVESIEQLPAARYQEAVRFLEEKRRKGAS